MQGSFTDNNEFLQPYGFDVGQSERGNVLKGLDLGVEGMRVGGQVSFWNRKASQSQATQSLVLMTLWGLYTEIGDCSSRAGLREERSARDSSKRYDRGNQVEWIEIFVGF